MPRNVAVASSNPSDPGAGAGDDPVGHDPLTGGRSPAVDETPSCSNASVGLLVAAMVAALAAAGILYYMGSLPCGTGLYVALASIGVATALVGAALASFVAYVACLGQPDPCPNAPTIKAMLGSALGILATIAAGVLGGATGSTGLCAIPTVGFLASVITAATTALIAAGSLLGLSAMLGVIIGLIVGYEKCRASSSKGATQPS